MERHIQKRVVYAMMVIANALYAVPRDITITNTTDRDLFAAPYYCSRSKEAHKAGEALCIKPGMQVVLQRPEKKRQGTWSPFFYKPHAFVATAAANLEDVVKERVGIHTFSIGEFQSRVHQVSYADIERAQTIPTVSSVALTQQQLPAESVLAVAPKADKQINKETQSKEPAEKLESALAQLTKVEELRKQDAVQTAPGAPEASEAEVVLSNTVEAEDADIVDAYDLLERDDVPTDDDYVDLAEEDGDKPYETSVAMELELLDQESEPEQKPQLTSMFNATMKKGVLTAQ